MIHSTEAVRTKLKTIILKLLYDKRMYGYEISQRVKGILNGNVQITEGGIYPTLHVLEKGGMLEAEREQMGKRVRKYYTLSKRGKSAVSKINRMTQ